MFNEPHLNVADGAVAGTAALAFFKAIPWPEISAFLASVYMLLRLVGMIVRWWKRK